MKTSFFSELLARLRSESPKFFIKLQAFGIFLAALGAGLLVIPGMPHFVLEVATNMVTAGAAFKLVGSLAVKDTNDLQPPTPPMPIISEGTK